MTSDMLVFAFGTMDNHSKSVCLVSLLHIIGYLIEILGLFRPYHFRIAYFLSFLELLPLVAIYLSLAAAAALTIFGVIEKRHLYFIPFFVVCALELIRPIKIFSYPSSFYMIEMEIMTLYPTVTLFLDLRAKSLQTNI